LRATPIYESGEAAVLLSNALHFVTLAQTQILKIKEAQPVDKLVMPVWRNGRRTGLKIELLAISLNFFPLLCIS
jgi:hypothetical protein